MDISPSALVKLLLPLTPLILKTLVLNALHLSANSSKQDARTELIITIIRKIVSVPKPLSYSQRLSLRDPGIKGPVWISKVTIPAPTETGALDGVIDAIRELGDGTETFTIPSVDPVEAEWTGHRSDVSKKEPRPDLPEADQYKSLMKETTSQVNILYLHGGVYFLMDPASHRVTNSELAKLTGGRCLSVRYRLAPQSPFPAQLLDAFIAYLYLLSPPPGSFHEPVQASSIILSGDSAGGNLALALSLLITTLIRTDHTTIPFHGRKVTLSSPAGVALNSPWVDIAHSLPSINTYAQYDYISPPTSSPPPPPDSLWPASPPRAEIFCNASILTHPLVSPLSATPTHFHSHSPTFIMTGYEMLTDSILLTARRLFQSNTYVELRGYEGMPHCFAMVFPSSPAGRDCFRRWADFCLDAVSGTLSNKKNSSAHWMAAKSNPPRFQKVEIDQLSELSDADVERLMRETKEKAMGREEKEIRAWEEGKSKRKSEGVSESDETEAMVESRAKL